MGTFSDQNKTPAYVGSVVPKTSRWPKQHDGNDESQPGRVWHRPQGIQPSSAKVRRGVGQERDKGID
jgi:hypothetical protein